MPPLPECPPALAVGSDVALQLPGDTNLLCEKWYTVSRHRLSRFGVRRSREMVQAEVPASVAAVPRDGGKHDSFWGV
jgi:hypothetical protein